ncbi:MAG: GLPGLI family protein [Sphingobacteriaceae bacterium]|nr:MAG: GLPGLI family protein [Sphingobacteriaceae bacterium]
MKNAFIIISCLLLAVNNLFAQVKVITSGTITFEKRLNLHAIAKNELGTKPDQYSIDAYEKYKRSTVQFGTLSSTLTFNTDKSLFTPVDKLLPSGMDFYNNPMNKQLNIVYTDFATNTNISQKEMYGDLFLVTDSTRKITWRLTDQTQDIAGFKCRRANGLILDSVYVVAFFTDEIGVSGGPESFWGLPGMILQVALPHENVIWTAKKVTTDPVALTAITPPKKGKKMSRKELFKLVKENMHSGYPGVDVYETRVFAL